jgi:hypothetical protein
MTTAAPEKNSGVAFLASFVGRLPQAPIYDLLVVGKIFLIWPLFPVRDQTSSNWILSNVVPLFVNGFRRSKETVKAARLPPPFFRRAI